MKKALAVSTLRRSAAVSEAVANHLNHDGREQRQGRADGRETDGIVLKIKTHRSGFTITQEEITFMLYQALRV